MRKEVLEAGVLRQLVVQGVWAISRQPTDDFIDLRLRASFLLRLGDIVGIDARDADRIDAMFLHVSS
ncbi:hypothetical protein SM0020_29375 [Sinorhizobium meliloti CCNWSX0020]|uniref:Uncharacterized protein n=1 Tax=Sinorhizobium meliloti CCNWSX0020 TaxID=1107881 RepID=H0G8N4_RHIML|nr:hypothetical protein SM0020_29375 [Sinorhizobium meliloti CCNWSX0020]